MDEVADIKQGIKRFRRLLIFVMSIILIMALVYLGYGVGAAKVCNKNGGILLNDFTCANNSMRQYCQNERTGEFYKLPFEGINVT